MLSHRCFKGKDGLRFIFLVTCFEVPEMFRTLRCNSVLIRYIQIYCRRIGRSPLGEYQQGGALRRRNALATGPEKDGAAPPKSQVRSLRLHILVRACARMCARARVRARACVRARAGLSTLASGQSIA